VERGELYLADEIFLTGTAAQNHRGHAHRPPAHRHRPDGQCHLTSSLAVLRCGARPLAQVPDVVHAGGVTLACGARRSPSRRHARRLGGSEQLQILGGEAVRFVNRSGDCPLKIQNTRPFLDDLRRLRLEEIAATP